MIQSYFLTLVCVWTLSLGLFSGRLFFVHLCTFFQMRQSLFPKWLFNILKIKAPILLICPVLWLKIMYVWKIGNFNHVCAYKTPLLPAATAISCSKAEVSGTMLSANLFLSQMQNCNASLKSERFQIPYRSEQALKCLSPVINRFGRIWFSQFFFCYLFSMSF